MGEYYSRVQMLITFIISPIATVIVRQILKRLVTKEYNRSGAVSYTHLDVYKRQELTDEFDITIRPKDLVPENFNSVDAIEKLVKELVEE